MNSFACLSIHIYNVTHVSCENCWVKHTCSSVQLSHSVVSDSLRPHGPQHTRLPCPSPNTGVTQTHIHWVGDAIQPSHPLSAPPPPAFNQHQSLFQWVNSLHQVAKVLEFQLQHQSFQSGLISFRMDWLDLLAVQGTLKSLVQHHSSKASIIRGSAFFTVQLLVLGVQQIESVTHISSLF